MKEVGVKPSEITYNALISACEKCGQVDSAFEVCAPRVLRCGGAKCRDRDVHPIVARL